MTGKARRHYFDGNDTPRVLWSEIPDLEVEEVVQPQPFPLEQALACLTDKQRFVIERRYGLNGSSEHTLEEVAGAMGMSFVAVHRIEQRALATLERLLGG